MIISWIVDFASVQLSGRAFLALLPLLVLVLGLVVYALVDLARAPRVRYLPKVAWVLIIVLVSAPLGALTYLILGRSHGDSNDPSVDGTADHHAGAEELRHS